MAQVHCTVFRRSIPDDLPQLPPLRMVTFLLQIISVDIDLYIYIFCWCLCHLFSGIITNNRYGLPFVSPHNLLVSTISGTGAAIEFTYVVIFIIYTLKKEKAKILGILTFVLTVFSIVALVSVFALHGETRKLFCGIAATIFTIIMYASPLLIVVSY